MSTAPQSGALATVDKLVPRNDRAKKLFRHDSITFGCGVEPVISEQVRVLSHRAKQIHDRTQIPSPRNRADSPIQVVNRLSGSGAVSFLDGTDRRQGRDQHLYAALLG